MPKPPKPPKPSSTSKPPKTPKPPNEMKHSKVENTDNRQIRQNRQKGRASCPLRSLGAVQWPPKPLKHTKGANTDNRQIRRSNLLPTVKTAEGFRRPSKPPRHSPHDRQNRRRWQPPKPPYGAVIHCWWWGGGFGTLAQEVLHHHVMTGRNRALQWVTPCRPKAWRCYRGWGRFSLGKETRGNFGKRTLEGSQQVDHQLRQGIGWSLKRFQVVDSDKVIALSKRPTWHVCLDQGRPNLRWGWLADWVWLWVTCTTSRRYGKGWGGWCALCQPGHCSNYCPDDMSQPDQNSTCPWMPMASVHGSRPRFLGGATWWPTWVGVVLVPDNKVWVRFGHFASAMERSGHLRVWGASDLGLDN